MGTTLFIACMVTCGVMLLLLVCPPKEIKTSWDSHRKDAMPTLVKLTVIAYVAQYVLIIGLTMFALIMVGLTSH